MFDVRVGSGSVTGGAKETPHDGYVLPNKSGWEGGTGMDGGAVQYMVAIDGGGIRFKGRRSKMQSGRHGRMGDEVECSERTVILSII